ncbi:dihydroxyacetone kinase subunit DhaL [Hafnia sp. HMSC23F03]|uniref:dihydroxyacetone kinase subunit DhaL n=1 Tax=Hafnia sp. HMSC23F03 TaxID=1581059 RepID=UPI0008A44694|nr:dihydroxyacetone kinase subunit DhaL [Hafnia sp. HMSC23F03]OFS12756.1 dihydroxyacetone kinase subunit L [Hafnia sp. HMSC23F03]
MNISQLKQMMLLTAHQMIKSEPMLTELDQVIGDGDHGIGMKRGFSALVKLMDNPTFQPQNVGEFWVQIGTTLMTSMGGASGAVFGTLFRAGGKSLDGEKEFNAVSLARWLNQGWLAVHTRGGAKPGDKTMVDALSAAADVANAVQSLPLDEVLSRCAEAADQGAEGTKMMVASFGRAKNLGERAIGHCDPGAVSMALILRFMAQYAANEVK